MNEKFKGLTEEEVIRSSERYGTNIIEEEPPKKFFSVFLESFKDPIIMLLLGIAGLFFVMAFLGLAEFYDPIGIVLTMCLVAFVTACNEMSSDRKYRELKNSTKHEPIKVHRDGKLTQVDIDNLVVGDIISLQSGDLVPVDGIIVDGEMKVDNSSLNGETDECPKTAPADDTTFPTEVTGDTVVNSYAMFRGTTVVDGKGLMKASVVGMQTVMGQMAKDANEETVESPLTTKLRVLAGQISKFGYIGAIVIAIVYMIHFIASAGSFGAFIDRGTVAILTDCIHAISISLLIVVCAVPEGLPLMIAIVLQQNTGKMLDNNVLVRKPIGIETAGSLNILFSDKTGTITKGHLEVVDIINGKGDAVSRDVLRSGFMEDTQLLGMLQVCMGINNDASYADVGNVIGGNPTDKALRTFIGKDVSRHLTEDVQVGDCKGFNSKYKFSQVYVTAPYAATFYKGAPERLLAKAKYFMDSDGSTKELNLNLVNEKLNEMASRAMRVIAFGYSPSNMTDGEINDDVVILGFACIRDDVRPEARDAIREVTEAGVQVVMITGDRLETAIAIGKEAGILTKDAGIITADNVSDTNVYNFADKHDSIAISSDAIGKLDDNAISYILPKVHVIARALPTDKSRMVRIAQSKGLVCGMTGDGVNDSPALKRADVGFGMGSGTDAAKASSDLIIIDDNFKSIRNAILYGRTIYHNILKFCKFQLSINVAAVLTSAVLPFLGIEEPLNVMHLLFVNLCMDTLGSMLLGQEPAYEAYMKEKPRSRAEKIVSKNMFAQFTATGILMFLMGIVWFKSGFIDFAFASEEQLKTGFFAAFMVAAIMNGFNVRTEGFNLLKDIKQNGAFFKVLFAMLAATIILCESSAIIPIVGKVFGCTAFGIQGWLCVAIAGVMIIPLDMLRKALMGTYKEA